MTRKNSSPGFAQVAGLGLGVEALKEVQATARHRRIPLEQLHVEEGHNPRGVFDQNAFTPERLADLAESLRREGVLQPIWVRPRALGGAFIIAGERRYHAAKLAGLRDIPAMEFDADDARASLLALIENGQREALHLLDETYAGFRALSARTGLAGEALVAYLNQVRKGRAPDDHGVEAFLRATFGTGLSVWAQHRARVFDLTAEEREAVWARRMDFSVATVLTRLPVGTARDRLRERALQENLTAPQVKALVDAERDVTAPRPLQTRVKALRSVLPRIERLEGEAASRAETLIGELEALLTAKT